MASNKLGSLEVHGIKELQKALKEVDADLAKELRVGFNEAAKLVLDAARPKVPRGKTGNAAASLKLRSTQRTAGIATGGTKAEYYPWLDFGGSVGRRGATKRPFIKTGRYIFPTLADKRPQIEAKVDEVMATLAKKAGFETEGKA